MNNLIKELVDFTKSWKRKKKKGKKEADEEDDEEDESVEFMESSVEELKRITTRQSQREAAAKKTSK